MIDTDKYEERIKSIPIRKLKVGCTLLEDSAFLRDAGLELLAEVKRLRDLHILACDYLQSISDGTLPDSEWPHIHAMIRGEEE